MTGIEELTGASNLSLVGAPGATVAPLGELTGLDGVTLEGFDAQDFSSLAANTDLNRLSITHTPGLTQEQLAVVGKFDKLQHLFLTNNEITSLEFLENIDPAVPLQSIDLKQNRISDLSVLSEDRQLFPVLLGLDLSQNAILDPAPLLWRDVHEGTALHSQEVYLPDVAVGEEVSTPPLDGQGNPILVMGDVQSVAVDQNTGHWTFTAPGDHILSWRDPSTAYYFTGKIFQTAVGAVVPAPASLGVTKTAKLSADDAQIDYEITVTNTGEATVEQVKVIDELPGLGALDVSWPGPDGVLSAGEQATATASYVIQDVDRGKTLTNAASAAGKTTDGRPVQSGIASVDVEIPEVVDTPTPPGTEEQTPGKETGTPGTDGPDADGLARTGAAAPGTVLLIALVALVGGLLTARGARRLPRNMGL